MDNQSGDRKDLTKVRPLSSARGLISQAQIAWAQIQEDAPKRRALSRGPGVRAQARREESGDTHRFWWLQVGQALAFGKRTSRSSHAYFKWLNENGLDGIPRQARRDAIWFAENIKTLGELPDSLATPGTIRQWAYKRDHPDPVAPPETHPTQSAQRDLRQVQETLPTFEAPRAAEPQLTGNVAEMQQVADLLLEASMHMLRSMDLIREVVEAIRQSQPARR